MATNILVYDPVRAQKAIDNLAELFASVEPSKLENCKPNVDMWLIAIALLAVADYASQPEVRKAFEKLPPEHFDIQHLDRLPDLGWAAWYSKTRYATLLSSDTTAKVPLEVQQRVADRKQRMLRVVEYHLQDNPTASLTVASIRAGTGYVDDATDLTALATLYETFKDQLSNDKKWYRESDIQEAQCDAAALMKLLGVGREDEARRELELLTRIFIRAQESYDEVQSAACFIFRHKPAHLEHFPSLYTAVRKPARTSEQVPSAQATAVPTGAQAPTPGQTASMPNQPVQNRSGSRGPFVE